MTTPTYDLAFFRRLFEGTTDEQWCTIHRKTEDNGVIRRCALGWCDTVDGIGSNGRYGSASIALGALFKPITGYESVLYVGGINDGSDSLYQQPTPRARILAAISNLERMAAAPAPSP